MRHNGLVPCNNTGVAILHVMDPDGSNTHPISVNSETEFDPSIMIDGRILYGRWEYVDKTALTIQSLWTVYPSGTMETALYANNMVFPEAVLDSRQVFSNPYYVVSTFSKHNSTPRGTIALIDTLFLIFPIPVIPCAIQAKPASPTQLQKTSCFSATVTVKRTHFF
jgi:hypothetical protein